MNYSCINILFLKYVAERPDADVFLDTNTNLACNEKVFFFFKLQ